jgi:hypothetical protein
MNRQCIYYQEPWRNRFVLEVKNPFTAALAKLLSPESSWLEKIQALRSLWKVYKTINGFPVPTLENSTQPGSHIIIGIRDRFFRRLVVPGRSNILRTGINFIIMVNETDFYRQFIIWWGNELRKSDWPPNGPLQPDPHFFKDE